MQVFHRFGNTPFLWSMYGAGELPQAFCRLCAVFGGTYYLGRKIQGVVVSADGKTAEAIVAEGESGGGGRTHTWI
jgi:RAB protein geranylgeranyltransferase component A